MSGGLASAASTTDGMKRSVMTTIERSSLRYAPFRLLFLFPSPSSKSESCKTETQHLKRRRFGNAVVFPSARCDVSTIGIDCLSMKSNREASIQKGEEIVPAISRSVQHSERESPCLDIERPRGTTITIGVGSYH